MRLIELTMERLTLEETLGLEAFAYGLYSIDARCYFSLLEEKNHSQQELMRNGYLFEFKPLPLSNLESKKELVQYLLNHHCQCYYPAFQKGTRNGYKISFRQENILALAKELGVVQGQTREELSGQLCLCL